MERLELYHILIKPMTYIHFCNSVTTEFLFHYSRFATTPSFRFSIAQYDRTGICNCINFQFSCRDLINHFKTSRYTRSTCMNTNSATVWCASRSCSMVMSPRGMRSPSRGGWTRWGWASPPGAMWTVSTAMQVYWFGSNDRKYNHLKVVQVTDQLASSRDVTQSFAEYQGRLG